MNPPRPFATMVAAIALVLALPVFDGFGRTARHPEPLAAPVASHDAHATAAAADATPPPPEGTDIASASGADAPGVIATSEASAANGRAPAAAGVAATFAALFLMPFALRRAGTRAVRDGIVDAILVLESPARTATHAPPGASPTPDDACGAGGFPSAGPTGATPAGAPPSPGAPRRAPRDR